MSRKQPSRSPASRAPSRKGKKKRGPSRLRAIATGAARLPWDALALSLGWLRPVLGLFLLPLCAVTTRTFLAAFDSSQGSGGVIASAPLWFFFVGVTMWAIAFWGLPRPLYLYVLGHELTHVVFVYLCFGRVAEFKVHRDGGYVVTDKNNLLISLSPYFVPFYSLLVIAAFGIAGIWLDLAAYHPASIFWGHIGFSWSWLFFGLVGVTWAFHLTFTAWMITKSQPDLRQNGLFFSLVVIYLGNVLVLSLLLILADHALTARGFGEAWLGNALSFCRRVTALF